MILDTFCQDNPMLKDYAEQVENCAQMFARLYFSEKKLLICGNGGSAADCEHIVGELVKEFRINRGVSGQWINKLPTDLASKLCDGLQAISLCSQTSIMSALANDIGYDYAFSQQVAVYGKEGDVLWALSTSGNSTGVINAALTAKAKGIKVVSFTNCDGGKLAKLADVAIKLPAKDTYRVQEFTLALYHAICARFEEIVWEK